jgi:hypothetical protein
MAQYAVDHGLVKSLSQRKPGDLVIYDKYGQATQSNGNRGHIGQVSDNINVTWESAGSNGTRRYDYNRLGWCMCVNMAQWFPVGPTAAQLAAIAAEMRRRALIAAELRRRAWAAAVAKRLQQLSSEEDDMNVCWIKFGAYDNVFHRLPNGQLGQSWWDAQNGWWAKGNVNIMAKQPGILIAKDSAITGRSKALNNATNDLDFYWVTPEGEVGHAWYTPANGWGMQTLPNG